MNYGHHMNYKEAAAIMARARKPIKRLDRRNTYMERVGDAAIAIRYHNTHVVTYHADGRVVLNSGGFKTFTTKERMNFYSDGRFHVSQCNRVWYVSVHDFKGLDTDSLVFADGFTIMADGTVKGAMSKAAVEKQSKLVKAVKDYARNFITALFDGKVPAPSGGDCWHCCMKTESGQTLGEATGSDHLIGHIKEKYYVPSLLAQAIEPDENDPFHTVSNAAKWTLGALWGQARSDHEKQQALKCWGNIGRVQLQAALERHLCRALSLPECVRVSYARGGAR